MVSNAWSYLLSGLAQCMAPQYLLFALLGSLMGTLVGVLPGLGATGAIAMLLPITLLVEPGPGLIMLAAIYYGAQYGGSTTAILVNIPGEASAVATAWEGYQLAKQGRGGPALGICAISSFVAALIAMIGLVFFAPLFAQVALAFGPPEYFALAVLGLSLVISLSGDKLFKGIVAALLGLAFSIVGLDPLTGVPRLTFGQTKLLAGIDFVPIIMGLFAVSEILLNVEEQVAVLIESKKVEWLPTKNDLKDTAPAMVRSGFVGFVLGLIPGCGAAVSSFFNYEFEKKFSAHQKDKFGKGWMRGLAAVEGANNATVTAAFVPLFSFGIPSGAALAVLLGGFQMYGLTPGPRLFVEKPELVWTLIASMFVGNIMLLVLNLPLVGVWARMATIPFPILMPFIVVFTFIGAYCVRYSIMDVWITLIFGIIGYLMKKFQFPVAPMVLSTVLASMLETSFMQTFMMTRGDMTILFRRPLSCIIIVLALASMVWSLWSQLKKQTVSQYLSESEEE